MIIRLLLIFAGWGLLIISSSSLDSTFVGNACFGWFLLCALLPVERMFGPQVIVRNPRKDD